MNNRRWMSMLCCLCAACVLAGCASRQAPHSPLAYYLESAQSDIPQGFRTYTFFLSPSYQYTGATADSAQAMEQAFGRFAKDIGDDNLAIFPRDAQTQTLSVAISKDLLDRIALRYDQRLTYTNGPYVIVLNHHPDADKADTDEVAVLSFNNIAPQRVIEGLNELELRIRRQESLSGMSFIEFWGEIKTWMDNTDLMALAQVTLEIFKVFKG